MDSVSRVTICLGWSNKLNLSLFNESVEAIIPPGSLVVGTNAPEQ